MAEMDDETRKKIEELRSLLRQAGQASGTTRLDLLEKALDFANKFADELREKLKQNVH